MIDWIIGILIAAIFVYIVGRGIYNLKHPEKAKSSCGCSCSGCEKACAFSVEQNDR